MGYTRGADKVAGYAHWMDKGLGLLTQGGHGGLLNEHKEDKQLFCKILKMPMCVQYWLKTDLGASTVFLKYQVQRTPNF